MSDIDYGKLAVVRRLCNLKPPPQKPQCPDERCVWLLDGGLCPFWRCVREDGGFDKPRKNTIPVQAQKPGQAD